jgi:tetratricopeptide (TPR) repeat protein
MLMAYLLLGTGLAAPAQSGQDELEAYIQKLKASKATGGNETAFMSIGSDFMYAQEYFEAKNFSSAAYSFRAIVQRQPDHPFANYQLAVSLLKQNDPEKTKEAQPYLERAFALSPGLKDRFAREMPQSTSTVSTKPTPTNPDKPSSSTAAPSLAAYIAKIKHSYATSGPETQMLSAGQEAHSGIQYYETGEFSSAETSFYLSLARDAQNPYVNYLMAVSLAAQGKTTATQPYYQKAIAGDAALQNQYTTDVATAKAQWDRKQQAKLVKPAPATKVVYGGLLTYGKYTCHQSIWNGPNASPAYRFDYKGYFELRKDGTYRWLDDGGTGRYSYNAKTGAITWLSGPMKGQAPKSSKFQKGTTVAQVTVEFSENYRWECGCKK